MKNLRKLLKTLTFDHPYSPANQPTGHIQSTLPFRKLENRKKAEIYNSFSGKIGYQESFGTGNAFEETSGKFHPIVYQQSGDCSFDYRWAVAIAGPGKLAAYNNWFPYYTLAECEAACRAKPRCKSATYEQEDITDPQKYFLLSTNYIQVYGRCHFNDHIPSVSPSSDDKTQYTIRMEDKGETFVTVRGPPTVTN